MAYPAPGMTGLLESIPAGCQPGQIQTNNHPLFSALWMWYAFSIVTRIQRGTQFGVDESTCLFYCSSAKKLCSLFQSACFHIKYVVVFLFCVFHFCTEVNVSDGNSRRCDKLNASFPPWLWLEVPTDFWGLGLGLGLGVGVFACRRTGSIQVANFQLHSAAVYLEQQTPV